MGEKILQLSYLMGSMGHCREGQEIRKSGKDETL
jgi:hypothetical protein